MSDNTSEIKRVKFSHIIESQIPEFLNEESPFFKEFLDKYYTSVEHQSGTVDLATNLPKYRQITAFNNESLIPYTFLTKKTFAGSRQIKVLSTTGWPDKYGLLKIDNEIIVYKNKIENKVITTLLGDWQNQSNIILLDNTKGIEVGMSISAGTNFPVGTTVAAVSDKFVYVSQKSVTVGGQTPVTFVLNSFENCFRGFSGIEKIQQDIQSEFLQFAQTDADEHDIGTIDNPKYVFNLSNLFLQEFFTKFKSEFLPGFENRDFTEGVNLSTVLTRAKDFYSAKGTDTSYKVMFKLLYGEDIDIIKPSEYTLVPSSNNYFKTRNVLVEKLFGGDAIETKGNFLNQNIAGVGTVNASIYNIEYRPIKNKDFYEISLDSGSFSGQFQVPGKTKVLEEVTAGANNILVDSTIGFGKTGSLLLKPTPISDFITVEYNDKTSNQFLGVTGITTDLSFGADVSEDKLAYAYAGLGQTSLVQFRFVNVIDTVDFTDTSNIRVDDTLNLSSFGFDLGDDARFEPWIYNIPTKHVIKSLTQQNINTFRVELFDSVVFFIDEELFLINARNEKVKAQIKDIEYATGTETDRSSNKIIVQTSGTVPSNIDRVEKIIVKASHNANYFPGLENVPVGIQNSYLDNNEESFYITSGGVPNYPIFATDNKVFIKTDPPQSGTSGGTTNIVRSVDPLNTATPFRHNFVTGDKIFWNNEYNSGLATGVYFVTNINDFDFQLSYSASDVFAGQYIDLVTDLPGQYLYKSGWENQNAKNQKLLRKFPYYKQENFFDDPSQRKTDNKAVGILVNGVELYPSSVFDEEIFFGQIDSVEVTNAGKDYDVINGPPMIIQDQTGSGAIAYANVTGSFKEVKLISPGIGYQEKPKITVSGGNGVGAVLESNFVKGRIVSSFKADGSSVNVSSDTIDFPSPHNFELGEEIIYESRNNPDIGGIVDNSTYFARPIGNLIISLHSNRSDAISGINTVNIGSVSSGFHAFKTLKGKNTITRIYVKNSGEGYSNKQIRVPARPTEGDVQTGISTADDYFYAPNHAFRTGEIVRYESTSIAAQGLSSTTEYFVTRIDNSKFKLTDAGIGTTRDDTDFKSGKITRISGVGSGTHIVKYPPIEIKVETLSGIGSTSVTSPTIEPVVLGSIESVYLEQGGAGYGCTNILNFHRRPNVGIATVQFQALLKPILVEGSIVDVQILASGRGYRKDSDIVVYGDGEFADISPIINEDTGSISGVRITDGGVNYNPATTTMVLQNRGRDAKFIGNVHEWKINQEVKSRNLINTQDAALTKPNTNKELGLQFISIYPPNRLRFQVGDNIDSGNLELTNNPQHSPILGYAYDGNPIYGPYGFSGSTGGPVQRLTSSYILNTAPKVGLRPPGYSPGYFTDDYEYNGSGDLDEFGGRYCVTPQFPDGTYAYFYAIDVDSSGVAEPKYPYIIGRYFKDTPIKDNFAADFNQDQDITKLGITRNIGPYYTNYENSIYDLIDKVDSSFKQEFKVTQIQSAGITSTTIFSPGEDYRVGDKLNLDNAGTNGTGTNIVVSHVLGKNVSEISVGVSTFNDVDLRPVGNLVYGRTQEPHGLLNGETIITSGVSTAILSDIEGAYTVSVANRKVALSEYLDQISATGITTFIPVTDVGGFEVNDIIGIGTELLRVTFVDNEYSRLGVNRQVGVAETHEKGSSVELKPTRFTYDTGKGSDYLGFDNKVLFFDPRYAVGVGSTGSIFELTTTGIGTVDTQTKFTRVIPEKQIYIKNHPYTTGQKIKYNVGLGGTSLTWSKTSAGSTSGIGTENLVDGGDVYAINFGVDYLGISTVGFPTMSDAVYWYNIAEPVGLAHSFTTTNPRITGTVQSFRGKITTGSPHGLKTGNRVSLEAVPFVVENAKIVYDPVLRKITTNKVSWSSTTFDPVDSSFFFPDLSFKSGDKVVYYGNGNNITELDNNEVYFVLRESSNRIKLCKFAADVKNGTGIGITAMPAGSYDLAKVNPPIRVSKGNILKIDVSDAGLADMRLDIFEDLQFRKKLDVNGSSGAFNLIRDGIPGQVGANIQIKTVGDFPRKSFYTLTPIVPTDQRKNQVSTDRSVRGFNSITVESSILEDNHEVLVADANTFSFNLEKQPTSAELFTTTSGLTTVFYETNSLDALGPIARTKINFEGKGYNKLPRVIGFDTLQGKNAVIKINSDKIGKIETTERIKDGFDYPTDPTLLPFLSVPTVIDVSGIARIQDVLVTDGGVNYHQPPNLKVLGNDKIDLQAVVQGGSVVGVQVLTNAFEFDAPLTIVPTRNTNGYDIDQITHSGDSVTVELLLDQQFYRPITTGYGSTDIEFPFKVGDKVYVEGCRLTPASFAAGELNFNSENYGYRQFDVTAVDEINFRVTYSVAGIATGTLGSYDDDFTLGYISNAKDLAKFQMRLIDDAKFFSGERITSPKFEARVVENGWDVELNQLRLTDSQGELRVGDIVYGEQSKLAGRVEDVNRFNIRTSLGISREKVGEVDQSVGILNNYLQRVSDNFYYQKFSYSIKSNISYSKWREAVRSIVHPSGFREFSDLEIVGDPKKDAITNSYVSVGLAKSTNMKVQTVEPKLDLIINIDNETYLGTRSNFAMVTEDDPLPDGGVQRVFFPEGRPLKSYILNKTNKVLKIDDVSNDFDGQLDRSGNLFGKTNFPLRTGGVPLFKKQFDSSDSSVVDLTNNTISIQNHNFQSGQKLLVDRGGGTAIGVATTSYTTNNRHILMGVSGAGGSSMFENGINFEVGGPVTGVSTVANPIVGAKQFGFGTGFPGISTRGTGATFTVMITYDTGTGQPISTNVVLREGGSGYYVGDNVSIAGTHLGGASPANDLTFPVTKISGTRVGIQTVYTNLEGTNDGAGSGAIFEVERDVNLDVSAVRVLSGGSGYAATNTISIAGTYIGGSTPTDNLFLTPTELGSNVMPDEVFVQKVDDVTIRFTGLSTSIIFDMKTLGTGIHTLRYENPNENALILVDGIVQSPIRNKKLNVTTGNGINATSQTLSITSGIGSVSIGDVLRLDDEFIKVNFIGDGTFVSSRTAEVNSTVDNNFYYDRNRANSTVTRVSNSTVTMDDNPPY
jgi:hypothetical protein